jgi:hypothetical protein
MAPNILGAAAGAGDVLQIEWGQPYVKTAGLLRCTNEDIFWENGIRQHHDSNRHITYGTTPNPLEYQLADGGKLRAIAKTVTHA